MDELRNPLASDLRALFQDPGSLLPADPFSRQILLLHTQVNGCRFREGILDLALDLKAGDGLLLLREPDNPHDERAVRVLDQREKFLGYVPRASNEPIAALMDAGKRLYAEVEEVRIDPEGDPFLWHLLTIRIYMED